MLIKMQVGHWHDGLAVKMDDDGLKWLDNQETNRRVTLSVTKDRQVIMTADTEGRQVHRHDEYTRLSTYPYATRRCPIEADIARFELVELTFSGTALNPRVLTVRLPLDHLLPWPKFISPNVQSFDPQELAAAELLRRMTSKLLAERRSGYSQAWVCPPDGIRGMLPKGTTWKDVMNRAASAVASP